MPNQNIKRKKCNDVAKSSLAVFMYGYSRLDLIGKIFNHASFQWFLLARRGVQRVKFIKAKSDSYVPLYIVVDVFFFSYNQCIVVGYLDFIEIIQDK